MPLVQRTGIHFNEPKRFYPGCAVATAFQCSDSAGSARASDTTNFFTELARRGLQDQTNWTADTYKTILSVTGAGLVAAYIGCTAGGVQSHTVEFTVDGTLSTVTIAGLASGERAVLLTGLGYTSDYTVADIYFNPGTEALDSDKATFGGVLTNGLLPTWRNSDRIPCLEFRSSLLIRAKHSATITNSTATAYSAVMYRNFLAA